MLHLITKIQNVIGTITHLIKVSCFACTYTNDTSTNELLSKQYLINFHYLSAIAWLIVIFSVIIIVLLIKTIRSTKKTQALLTQLIEEQKEKESTE